MHNRASQKRSSTANNLQSRRLAFEQCEERNLLSANQADIVFLLDESGSDADVYSQAWIQRLVAGNTGDGVANLASKLADVGIDDVRYGLVGFGENSDVVRYAHSQLFQNGEATYGDLFGEASTISTSELNTVFGTNPDGNLMQEGGAEDGWDALEHAISEYDFRDGAAVVFVLVHNDEGRIELDDAFWTRAGVISALQSKNVILNSFVAGNNFLRYPISSYPDNALPDWQPAIGLEV